MPLFRHYFCMQYSRRRLPHLHEVGRTVFLTWRLKDSLPPGRRFPVENLTSGEAFVAWDRLLDEGRCGPMHLAIPEVADLTVSAIRHYEATGHYALHAFAVMPNHVHMLITPALDLPSIMRALKAYTARKSNEILASTGKTFWQDESFDRLVRDRDEFGRIRRYIAANPVKAGLVGEASLYRWSSAWVGL
ncbi:MAG: transposase [Candidatus Solibacter usitatus]|nr:transposase [Candidatus Solibacter usitatus]